MPSRSNATPPSLDQVTVHYRLPSPSTIFQVAQGGGIVRTWERRSEEGQSMSPYCGEEIIIDNAFPLHLLAILNSWTFKDVNNCSSIFPSRFLNRNGFFFFFLLLVPVQCFVEPFWIFPFAQSRKILSKFFNLSVILKHRGQNFVMTSIVHLFCNRS